MTYKELNALLWKAFMECLKLDPTLPENANKIRSSYPPEGAPAWRIDEDVIFFILNESLDNYSRQVDSLYIAGSDTVYKQSTRTRYWSVSITAYGPNACENLNSIKDRLMSYKVKLLLNSGKLYIVPQQSPILRSPELFSGQWWNRWDYTAYFNEHYILPDEDVGRIEYVSINTRYNQ